MNKQLASIKASGVVRYVLARLSSVSPWLMVIISQSSGNWHEGVNIGMVGVTSGIVAEGVRVGSPGCGVWMITVGDFFSVG